MSRQPYKIIDDMGHKKGYVIFDNTQDYLISIRVFDEWTTAEMFTQIWEYELDPVRNPLFMRRKNIDQLMTHDGITTEEDVIEYLYNAFNEDVIKMFIERWRKEEMLEDERFSTMIKKWKKEGRI